MTFVAAFDLATLTGLADGRPGDNPRLCTWNFAKVEWRPARLAMLANLLETYFSSNRVTHLFYEAPLNIAVANKIGAAEGVIATLRGMVGVLEMQACKAGITVIEPLSVNRARHYLVGKSIAKGEGKREVAKMCSILGWKPENDNESDAAAVWALGCAMVNPKTAHSTAPLFA